MNEPMGFLVWVVRDWLTVFALVVILDFHPRALWATVLWAVWAVASVVFELRRQRQLESKGKGQ